MAAVGPSPLKLVVTLAIDYVRWTQLAPLVTIWGFALAMLAVIFLVSSPAASWELLESVLEWIAGLPVLGQAFVSRMESLAGEDGTIKLGGNELKAAALKAWGLVSLAFLLLALIANWLFGPFKPWPLKRKLGIVALACIAMPAGYAAGYFVNPELFNGPASRWMLSFGSIGLMLFIVSAWCLCIAHALGLASKAVENKYWSAPVRPGPRSAAERR